MSESDDEVLYNFVDKNHFNQKTSPLISDAWAEVEKSTKFFSTYIKQNGLNSFLTTVVVFNNNKEFVGVVTSRPVTDKEDLYRALCEILFFPVAIRSQLFIVITDIVTRDPNTGEKKSDALSISFISPNFCLIYSLPYAISANNGVEYDYENSYFVSVVKSTRSNQVSTSSDMIELFYVFSHVDNFGPFTYDEVLAYFDDNNFTCEIVNKDNLYTSLTSLV